MHTKTILCSLFVTLILTPNLDLKADDLRAVNSDANQIEQQPDAALQQPATQPQLPTLLRDVPRELRMHLPTLAPEQGCWVEAVPADSSAYRIGLLHGDLLIEVNGQKATVGLGDETLYNTHSAVVLRRGQYLSLPVPPQPRTGNANQLPQWMWDRLPPEARRAAAGMAPPNIPITNWTHFGHEPARRNVAIARAQSTVAGAQGIAVSRAGNQLSLDMTVSALGGKRIHLQGDVESIRRDVEQSNLSDEAKREILDVVNGQG